jgi:hypothetical protein
MKSQYNLFKERKERSKEEINDAKLKRRNKNIK